MAKHVPLGSLNKAGDSAEYNTYSLTLFASSPPPRLRLAGLA